MKVEAEYRIPIEHHNPMEPHAAIAFWEGDRLTIFDKSQEVYGDRKQLAASFGVPEENVTVDLAVRRRAPSGRRSGRTTTRRSRRWRRASSSGRSRSSTRARQMFTGHGYRPYTIQQVALGADRSGKLSAIIHDVVHNTSTFEEFSDNTTSFPRQRLRVPEPRGAA